MKMPTSKLGVDIIKISSINFNKENPREIFNQEEEDNLYLSIKRKGVLVPILVTKEDGKYLLIDGERRVRAALKSGLKEIPANIIEKDSSLEYAIKMFHIHNLRVGWRLMAMALELEKFKKESKITKEKDLVSFTGLSISKVRDCNKLLSYPEPIRKLILEQEALPRSEKKRIGKDKILSDNFFIELHSGLNILKKFEQKMFDDYGFDELVSIFIKKRKTGNLNNVTLFREFKKIVKLQNEKSRGIVKRIISQDKYTIDEGFDDSGLKTGFLEKKFYKQSSLFLENLNKAEVNKGSIRTKEILKQIKKRIEDILNKK